MDVTMARLLRESPEQALLEVFRELSLPVLRDHDYQSRMQAIKEGLFERDFVKVFTDKKNLAVYCMRWVPPRAMAYLNLFQSEKTLLKLLCNDIRITAIGAGAGSELAAFAGMASLLRSNPVFEETFKTNHKGSPNAHKMTVNSVDFGDWAPLLKGFSDVMSARTGVKFTHEQWPQIAPDSSPAVQLPPFGNGAAESISCEAGKGPAPISIKPVCDSAKVETTIVSVFTQADVLSEDPAVQARLAKLYGSSHLITACFVINEVYLYCHIYIYIYIFVGMVPDYSV
jgi:hypothetical protein